MVLLFPKSRKHTHTHRLSKRFFLVLFYDLLVLRLGISSCSILIPPYGTNQLCERARIQEFYLDRVCKWFKDTAKAKFEKDEQIQQVTKKSLKTHLSVYKMK